MMMMILMTMMDLVAILTKITLGTKVFTTGAGISWSMTELRSCKHKNKDEDDDHNHYDQKDCDYDHYDHWSCWKEPGLHLHFPSTGLQRAPAVKGRKMWNKEICSEYYQCESESECVMKVKVKTEKCYKRKWNKQKCGEYYISESKSAKKRNEANNAVWDQCCSVSYKWMGWMGWNGLRVRWSIEQLIRC